jgi:catechol 2,3-dioxygenase-like lactoylglutathione lyase family enzyme
MAIKESIITINVRDLERSISFYESIGLTIKNRWGNYFAELTAPGVIIGLHPTNESNVQGNPGHISMGFTVDDFEESKSFLQKTGIKTRDRVEEGGQFLHFSDPDGTALYFIKPKGNCSI